MVSSEELACTAPGRHDLSMPSDVLSRYRLVGFSISCCLDASLAVQLGSTDPGSSPAPADCEAGCTALDGCRFFSHSAEDAACTFCADCAYSRREAPTVLSSWQRLGAPRSAARLRVALNGMGGPLVPELAVAPVFTYYQPASLVLSATHPVGGPVAGGTIVTVHGSGLLPSLGGMRCAFGSLQQPRTTAGSISADGQGVLCASPPQPDVRMSMLSVRSVNAGSGLPPAPGSGHSHRWTVDGCNDVGANHSVHCTPIEGARAAVSCCSLDIHTYMHACMHTYIHTCIGELLLARHTYMHACMHAYIHTYVHR